MKERISQSLIKDMKSYQAEELCGHVLRKKWIDGILLDDASEAMKLGSYFEYITFNNLPKSGIVPKPVLTDAGKLTAPYQRCHNAKETVTAYFDKMGFKILHRGKRLTKGRFEGTIDLIVECTKTLKFQDGFVLKKGTIIVIDIKYSGLLDDRWSKHGWMWTDEQREYHGIQAAQYHYISDLPFFFLIKDSGNNDNVKFIRVTISGEAIESHLALGNETLEHLQLLEKVGVKAYPSVNVCNKCLLRKDCKDKHEIPHPIEVKI